MPKFRSLLSLLLLAAMMFAALPPAAQAQDGIPGNCEYTSGAYYRAGLFPRYEARNARLVLVDWFTGEDVQVLDTSVPGNHFGVINWSPDCRYLVGAIGPSPSQTDTYFWDVITNQRLRVFPDAHPVHEVTWDPTATQVVVQTRNGSYLWHVASGEPLLIADRTGPGLYGDNTPFRYLDWDHSRGQLIAVLRNDSIVVYDDSTGEIVERLRGGPNFFRSLDNSHLVTWGVGYITVINRDSGETTTIRAGWGNGSANQIALSPNNRYLVVGFDLIRVWDLENPPGNVRDRQPTARYEGPEGNILRIRFLDDTTLETQDMYGVTQRWDLLTGAELPTE